MTSLEIARRAAARRALELVRDDYIVGLGSGGTMALAVEEISAIFRQRMIDAVFIPTSYQIERVAMAHGLRLTSLNEHPKPDLALDGADQVDDTLNLIKGAGAALTREKVIATAAKKFVVIIDEQKRSGKLGHYVPTEVLPFAYEMVIKKIATMGGRAVLREGKGKVGPVITDNGNFVVDAHFGVIEDPARLEILLNAVPGIVETGLFIEMVDEVYIGKLDGTVEIAKRCA